jgi:hypothetical protein
VRIMRKPGSEAGLSASGRLRFGLSRLAGARPVPGLSACRTLRRALLSCGAAKQLVKFGVQLFTLGNQFFRSRDFGIYLHMHHLLSRIIRYRFQEYRSSEFLIAGRTPCVAMRCGENKCISMGIVHILLRAFR